VIHHRRHPCDALVSNVLPQPFASCLHLCGAQNLIGALHEELAASSMRDQKLVTLCDSSGNPN
jgi:hypothetical protein